MSSQIYILISIIILLVITALLFFVKGNKKPRRLSVLAGLAFVFIVAGIVFGGEGLVGYSLMGIGVLLALIDMIKKFRKK